MHLRMISKVHCGLDLTLLPVFRTKLAPRHPTWSWLCSDVKESIGCSRIAQAAHVED